MTRTSGGRSVDRIDTATEADTERTPLLAGTPTPTATTPPFLQEESSTATTATYINDPEDDNRSSPADADPLSHLRAALRPRVILLCFVLIFLLELGIGMAVPPINAVMESIICRQMHPDAFSPPPPRPPLSPPSPPDISPLPPPGTGTGIGSNNLAARLAEHIIRHYAGGIVLSDDPICKSPDVQGYLAMLRGWSNTFECIPGIVGAVPYGILSDRWGRRPVLGLSVFGIVLSYVFMYAVFYFSNVVPLWMTWFSSAFQLIGGGGAITVAMVYTILADVIPISERATVFFQISAVFLASQMVAGPIGGAMLVWGPWTPLLVGLAVLIVANLGVVFVLETMHVHDRKRVEEDGEWDGHGTSKATSLWQKAWAGLAEVWDFILGNKSLAFLMVSLVFCILGRFVGELLLQYATDRYGWSWSTASMVLTIRNAGSLVTLLCLLPVAGWLCVQRLGMTAVAKDLWLARWSGVTQILGSLLIAAAVNGGLFSFGLIWLAIGSGMTALIRSLLNALVEEHHVGTVNSLVGFMEMVGGTAAGPLLAASLRTGLDLGGAWIGLPFITSGSFFMVSVTILWVFRLPNETGSPVEPPC
ncbi:major facilitator superfamily domain-containing protein [Chaetomium strumarium]|uniref:Major facilitator superfamily domain-containing protein n=1 Tax=Chaetomium strumarium TaxID=1170767 RepID=A0AAJ0H3U3_9PEZI|nr:major facilitator superfamily domain-containing protein [Chaetomium strumarium]